jgi:hypothetical protein
VLTVIGAGAVVWFRPSYQTHVLLRKVAKFRPGITEAKQIEDLERKGLVRKLGVGCIGGFEHPNETQSEAEARFRNGEVCYSFLFRNMLPDLLHLAPTAGIYGTLTVKGGHLSVVRLGMQVRRLFYTVIDSDCELCARSSNYLLDTHVNGLNGAPGNVFIQLTRTSTEQQRRDAYAINLDLLTKTGEVKDGRDLNPGIWRQQLAH